MATLTQTESAGVRVLRLDGSLTQDGIASVCFPFEAATQGPVRVVVDLGGVPVLTTPGLSMLISAARRLKEAGGRLVVTRPQDIVADLLRRCRLDAVFDIVADADEAGRVARD